MNACRFRFRMKKTCEGYAGTAGTSRGGFTDRRMPAVPGMQDKSSLLRKNGQAAGRVGETLRKAMHAMDPCALNRHAGRGAGLQNMI